MDTISSAIFEGVCYRCVANFVNNSNYAPIFAMELEKLLVNGKITRHFGEQICLPSVKSNVTNNKNEL